jgi:hypothetical protein
MRTAFAGANSFSMITLLVLTCIIPLLLVGRIVWAWPSPWRATCRGVDLSHSALVREIVAAAGPADYGLVFPNPPSLTAEKLTAHKRIRFAASAFLGHRLSCRDSRQEGGKSLAKESVFLLRRAEMDLLEFSHGARYPIDGVLLYIFSVLGLRSRVAVELDGAQGSAGFRGCASLVLYNGWDALVMHGRWSGYNRAQHFYERAAPGNDHLLTWRRKHFPESFVVIAELQEMKNISSIYGDRLDVTKEVNARFSKHGVGGDVDVVFLVLDGVEMDVWDGLTAVTPRVVVIFYQDYWGSEASVTRTSDALSAGEKDGTGRRRLYVGGSISALVSVALARGYRLIWCMRSAPIAFFERKPDDSNGMLDAATVLPSISTRACLSRRNSVSWRKDMEAQWQNAQRHTWTQHVGQRHKRL